MSMFKLHKLPLRVPKRTTLLNRKSIVFAFNGVKIQVREKSDSNIETFRISVALQQIIKKQVEMQEHAAQKYLGFALSFLHPNNSKPGAGGYFMKKYEYSLRHVQDFLQYLILRGGTPMISDIALETVDENLTFRKAINDAWFIEKYIIVCGEEILSAAKAESDYACADFVTSFLTDQIRDMHEIDVHWYIDYYFTDTHAFYHHDLELAKEYPYEYKKKQYVYL